MTGVGKKRRRKAKALLVLFGVFFALLGLSLHIAFPYQPPENRDFPTRYFTLGEEVTSKTTSIEEWLGYYGGEYHFQIRGLKIGDSITVEVYVDGKLEDKFVEVVGIGWQEYRGDEEVVIYITAVEYSEFYAMWDEALELTYDSHGKRYGGRPFPLEFMNLTILMGILLAASGLVLLKKSLHT